MPTLTLVGTVHLDPEGPRLLEKLLDDLNPETITVDVSPYGLQFRRARGPAWRERLAAFMLPDGTLPPGLEAVAAQLRLPFEYQAACDYAERHRSRVIPVGNSRESRRLLGLLNRELLAGENLRTLASQPKDALEELVAREWGRARRGYLQGSSLGSEASRQLSKQDRYLARQIRKHAACRSLVHAGGWEHLKGLSDLLSDLRPAVRLLSP